MLTQLGTEAWRWLATWVGVEMCPQVPPKIRASLRRRWIWAAATQLSVKCYQKSLNPSRMLTETFVGQLPVSLPVSGTIRKAKVRFCQVTSAPSLRSGSRRGARERVQKCGCKAVNELMMSLSGGRA